MQIALKLNQNTLIVSLTGELDHHEAGQAREFLERAISEKNIKNLIFDFSKLSFMDSSGIGMVIGRYKRIKSIGGQVALVCSGRQVERLVEMSGLKRLMKVYPDVTQALTDIKEA